VRELHQAQTVRADWRDTAIREPVSLDEPCFPREGGPTSVGSEIHVREEKQGSAISMPRH